MLFDLPLGGDYEEFIVVQDRPSGLRAVIALHSTTRGPASGGIRRMPYPNEEAAIRDAARLAAMMSYKCAMADLPAGGGKTVMLQHDGLDRVAAYRALGRVVERLGGRYLTGPDVGTTDDDMREVRRETRYANPEGNDAGAATARGVVAGLRGLLAAMDGSPSFAGKRFVVQGLGAVGLAVTRDVLRAGGEVLATDLREDAVQAAVALGANGLAPQRALTTECDVLVPCALGDVLSRTSVPLLKARAVCGSANNQLADDDAGALLHKRGIRYAPDFVVNSGAVIEGVLTMLHGATTEVRDQAARQIDRVEATVRDVLRTSLERDMPPADVALDEAKRRLRA